MRKLSAGTVIMRKKTTMKTILICEDELDAQKFLKEILLENDYDVFTAKDGEESIRMTKKIKPDLILLDIRMPKLDGLEAAKEIRKFNTDVKIVFLTAFESMELSKEAAKYDIVDYLVKPISSKNIIKVIEQALK
jgi:CheY-like chemotaxis protein